MSNNQIETLSTTDLTTVHGGADDASYIMQDVKNAASGAQAGSRFGVLGSVIGGGAGFMSRNVGNLIGAGRDLYNEHQRGAALDAQLKAVQGKK